MKVELSFLFPSPFCSYLTLECMFIGFLKVQELIFDSRVRKIYACVPSYECMKYHVGSFSENY